MFKTELMTEIDEIIKRGYAASLAHTADTNTADIAKTEQKIASVLNEAAFAKKGSIQVYEQFRNRIRDITTTVRQYENAICALTRTLRV